MMYVEVWSIDPPPQPDHADVYSMLNLGTDRLTRLAICNLAVTARFGEVSGHRPVGDALAFEVGGRSFLGQLRTLAQIVDAGWEVARAAILVVDDALWTIRTSGDNGPALALDEVVGGTERRWDGLRRPAAVHADGDTGVLHVLWDVEHPTAAETDPGRWSPRWTEVQSWVMTRQGPKHHLLCPLAWYDLRVRPLGPPRPRQRHVGAVTA